VPESADACRQGGSHVEVQEAATAEAWSQLGILDRCLCEAIDGGGRYVSWEKHGMCAKLILATLAVIEAEQLTDRRCHVGVPTCGQATVSRPVAPVIWSQMVKRMVISKRWSAAARRCRRGRKWGEMPQQVSGLRYGRGGGREGRCVA
jgi:hypothetical protein